MEPDPVDRYLEVGLRLGRHLDGLVDAYYGPAELAARRGRRARAGRCRRWPRTPGGWSPTSTPAPATSTRTPALAAGAGRRAAHGRPQARGRADRLRRRGRGLLRRAAPGRARGRAGGRPPPARRGAARHRRRSADRLDRVAGGARRADRQARRRRSHSLAEDFRERTDRLFGLPDGEHIDFVLVTNKPWSGFNYYLGGLRSRVAINIDLPVLSTSLGHLVAHEAYPGHHTEHTRKEVGLVRRRDQQRGDDLPRRHAAVPARRGPRRPRPRGARRADRPERGRWPTHLRPLGIRYDTEVVAACRRRGRGARPRCGATSRCCSTRTAPMPTRRSPTLERWVTAAPQPGREGGRSSSPTRPGGPTSPATSRACPSAGRSSPAIRPVRASAHRSAHPGRPPGGGLTAARV